MSILYTKLFKLMAERKISKTNLQSALGISTATLAKLSKNENVSLNVINDICIFLNCQPGDIMEIDKKPTSPLLTLLKEEKEMKLKGGLYHQTQVKLAYNSNRIEGSILSEEQTRYIYETNTIEAAKEEATPVDDIIETINHFQCFDYMIDVAEQDLTENLIKEFHRLMKCNTSDSRKDWFNLGDYKARPNMIGDSKTTPPKKVNGEMAKLLADYRMLDIVGFEDIVEFHYRFESIHPFQDGNGRVGRMIMFKECLRWDVTPFIIDEKFKLFYYRGLKEFPNEKGYLIDICYSVQDEYKKLINYFFDVQQ